ncbi:hypothetical protein [Dactylosporangium sp. NPDC051541]|uniref:hypothetical protein n=1 Tax=Dactylosporangium sp. NPDC051541 TaxID=3363977 RepID=UPI0037BC44E1
MIPTDHVVAELRRRELAPPAFQSLFLAGSLVRGWGHARSDADAYLIVDEPWAGPSNADISVRLNPPKVPANVFDLDDRRWEVRYWQAGQVDELLAKVSWAAFEGGAVLSNLTVPESILLARLPYAHPIAGSGWLERRQEELAKSAFRAIVITRLLSTAESGVEDALGLLESGDDRAAVLAAQAAFLALVDAFTAYHGDVGFEVKWRARRIAELGSPVLPADAFWDVVTMRGLDPDRPRAWVESVLLRCRELSLEVEI